MQVNRSRPGEVSENDVKVTVALQGKAILTEGQPCCWSIGQPPYPAAPRYFESRAEFPLSPAGVTFECR